MKGKIIKEENKSFKPFKLELKVKSLNEARLLFHVFNNLKLDDIINGRVSWYDMENYHEVIGTLDGGGISDNIEEYLKECGLNLWLPQCLLLL